MERRPPLSSSAIKYGRPQGGHIPNTFEKLNVNVHFQEIADRFRLALEHYEKYSFAVQLELECAMRILQLLIMNRAYLSAENFIRERMGRYLDDNFSSFDNAHKSRICLNCAHVYGKVGHSSYAANCDSPI